MFHTLFRCRHGVFGHVSFAGLGQTSAIVRFHPRLLYETIETRVIVDDKPHSTRDERQIEA